MNKKIIIPTVIIILIIALAIFVGINLSKKESNPTSTNPVNETSSTPNLETTTPSVETASPEPTETPLETPTTESTANVDISKMNVQQKKDYAKQLVKEIWEKSGVQKQVYYSIDNIEGQGKYIISVRDETNTEALVWYEVDINNKTCKTIN